MRYDGVQKSGWIWITRNTAPAVKTGFYHGDVFHDLLPATGKVFLQQVKFVLASSLRRPVMTVADDVADELEVPQEHSKHTRKLLSKVAGIMIKFFISNHRFFYHIVDIMG